MAIDNSGLVYLFDSIFQIENLAGRPVCPGHIEVFVAGTDTKYITYQNFDGTRNPFKVPLNSDGRAVILVEAQYKYDVYIYDSFNNMICSRLNVAPAVGGDVSVSGLTEVYHDGSLSGDGTPYAPLAVVSGGKVYSGIEPIVVNNDEDKISAQTATFGVESPLYFVKDEASATVIGVDQSAMENFLTGKANTTALNRIRDNMMSATAIGGVNNIITGYNGSAFSAGSTYSGISPVVVDNENNTISVSSKELEAQAPLQITDVGSAYQLSITANINSPRTRVIEYGTDRWSDVKSAMDDMSAGNIDYVVMKYTDASGNEYYAPLDKYAPDAACHFVCPSNEQDTVYGYGQRRKDTIFTINSGDQWVTRNVRPFIGRVIGGTNVTVDVQGEDYVISANGIDTSATEAIDLVTANSGDWNTVTAKLDKADSGNFYPMEGNPSGFLTTETDWTDTITAASSYAYEQATAAIPQPQDLSYISGKVDDLSSNKLDSTAFSTVSGSFLTAHQALPESATWNTVTSKLDTTAFSTVSGDFITALSDSGNWNSTYNTVSTNSGSWSGRPQIPVSGINIDIYEADGKIVFSGMTGGGSSTYTGDAQGALDEVYTNSGDWNSTHNTVSDNSASWGQGGKTYTGISPVIVDNTADTISVSAKTIAVETPLTFAETNTAFVFGISGTDKWDSTYDTVHDNSANWTGGGGSTYTGDAQGALDEVYANSANWNSAAGLNELPVSAGEGMDIQNVDGNIVFSCTGGSVPEGVLVASGLEYDNIEISGYSGSAFKDVALSETVATNSGAWGGNALPISAGPGIKVELTDGKLLFSTDETVLWEDVNGKTPSATGDFPITLTESISNFKTVKFYWQTFNVNYQNHTVSEKMTDLTSFTLEGFIYNPSNVGTFSIIWVLSASGTTLNHTICQYNNWTNNNVQSGGGFVRLFKVVGINRTAGGN